MEVVDQCCAGLNVHKRAVTVCVFRHDAAGKLHREIRTFGTMTRDLGEMGTDLFYARVARSPGRPTKPRPGNRK